MLNVAAKVLEDVLHGWMHPHPGVDAVLAGGAVGQLLLGDAPGGGGERGGGRVFLQPGRLAQRSRDVLFDLGPGAAEDGGAVEARFVGEGDLEQAGLGRDEAGEGQRLAEAGGRAANGLDGAPPDVVGSDLRGGALG